MQFSSLAFLFYFLPAAITLYYLCSFSRALKTLVLLLASLTFYAWGNPATFFILVISIIANYCFGLCIHFAHQTRVKTIFLILACISNAGLLFAFKHLNAAIDLLNDAYHTSFQELPLLLPIGLSFFTLKAISYVVDVYREVSPVQKNPFYLGVYISFFGTLLAGPITSYNDVQEQLTYRKESVKKFSAGCCRFVVGLSKKVLIANQLAVVADTIFNMSSTGAIPASLAWIGAIAFALQIYYDFSGYSDMAIGLGLMFGFKFEENFNFPHIAKSVTEFWRRWHISLGQWFLLYVYLPLGGSKLSNMDKVIRNLFIMWLLIGFWHGPKWTFLIWGLLNFALIAFEKLFSIEAMTKHYLLRGIYVTLATTFLWVIFRAENLVHAGWHLSSMFGFFKNGFYSPHSVMFLKEYAVFFILALVFTIPVSKRANRYLVNNARFTSLCNFLYPFCIAAMFLLCLIYLAKGSNYPFIFFSF